MKKRILWALILFLFISIWFADQLYIAEYNIGLVDLFRGSSNLTFDEKQWLAQHGPIVYASDHSTPPLRYVDSETGQYKGVALDFLQAMSLELGTEIVVKPMVWQDALDSLAIGKTDICDMYPSDKRARLYDFSDPIYYQRGVIVIPKDSDIRSIRDLAGTSVGTQQGDYVNDFLIEQVDGIRFRLFEDYTDTILALKNGDIDAAAGDEPVLIWLMQQYNMTGAFQIVQEPLYELESVFSVPKGEKELLSIINKGIYALNRRNVMEQIQQKWFGISTPITNASNSNTLPVILLFTVSTVLIAVFLSWSWNIKLKAEVNRRTEELYQSRNDLQTTFDSLTHLMVVLRRNGRIAAVNQAFCTAVSLEETQLLGRLYTSVDNLLNADQCGTFIDRSFETGTSDKIEVIYEKRQYEITTFPLPSSTSKVERLLILCEDITDIRVAQKQMLQENKMAAIGQLAAGMAHEIRNPLGIIRNYVFLLKRKNNDPEPVTEKAYTQIEHSVDQASNIIDNLLNFSRISSDQFSTLNIFAFFKDIIELNHKVMEKRDVIYRIECDPNLQYRIPEESLKMILINLISNAIDAMPDGGHLILGAKKQDQGLRLYCQDTGTGIDQDKLDEIFNPFFTTKSPGEGTGLGLFIAYNEVKKLGGELQAQSELGVGTTFTIHLPPTEEAHNGE